MRGKKGFSLISIYWFFILGLIAGGVFLMVNSFYSSPYDVRKMESELLGDLVINCLSPNGKMNHLLIIGGKPFPAFRDNFPDRCNLRFEGKEEWDPIEYYVQAVFYEGNKKFPLFNMSYGNQNFIGDCGSEKNFKELATCFRGVYYAYDDVGKLWKIEVLSIVAKSKENLK